MQKQQYQVQKGTKGFALIDLQSRTIIDWFGDETTANGICKSLNEYQR